MSNWNIVKKKPIAVLIVLMLIALGFWYISRPGRHLLDSTAQPRPVTARGSLAEDEKNTIEIFQSVAPAVVYITSVELRQNLFTLNVYAIPKGTGSGIVWDSNGYIVTNLHVIEDAGRVEVTLADATKWKAAVVGVAPDKDLAVLRISAPSGALHPIPPRRVRESSGGSKGLRHWESFRPRSHPHHRDSQCPGEGDRIDHGADDSGDDPDRRSH